MVVVIVKEVIAPKIFWGLRLTLLSWLKVSVKQKHSRHIAPVTVAWPILAQLVIITNILTTVY